MNPGDSATINKAVEPELPWMYHLQARILIVLVIFGIGLALSLYFFYNARAYEQEKTAFAFHEASRKYIDAFQDALQLNQHELDALHAFFVGSEKVERHEFSEFVNHLLFSNPSIQALEWIPRVSVHMRDEFEKQAREEGSTDFEITEERGRGNMIRAGERDEYFPVFYVEPLEGNEQALGFDLHSSRLRREALESARDTGLAAATARITLVQEKEQQFGFLVFHPVYEQKKQLGTIDDRRRYLKGFVLGVYRVGDIFEKAIAKLSLSGLHAYLFDKTAPEDSRFLYAHAPRLRTEPVLSAVTEADVRKDFHYAGTIDFSGRKWLLILKPTRGFFVLQESSVPWIGLAVGILFSSILGGIVMLVIDHSAATRLHATELEKELLERRKIESKLSRLVKRLEVLMLIEKAIVGAESLEEIAGIVTEGVPELVPCERSSVVSFDFDKNAVQVLAVTAGAETQLGTDYGCSLDDFGVSEDLRSGKVRIHNDLASAGKEITATDKMLFDEGIRSYMNVPLMYEGRLVGSLNIGRSRPEAFSDEDIYVVEDVASSLAVAIKSKEIEKDLFESEKKFRSIYDSAMDGILITHVETKKFISGNNMISTMLGYSPDEIVRLSVNDIHPKEDLPYVIDQFEKQVRGEIVIAENIPMKRKDGSIFYAEISSSAVALEGEAYVVGIFRDISERKKAEEALRYERDRAQTYLDVAGVMLLVIDIDGKVKLINKKGCDILDCSEEDVIGANWFDVFIPVHEREDMRNGFNKIVTSEIAEWEYHVNPVVTGNGQEKIIAWHDTLLKNEQGDIIGMLSSGEDISERRRLEEQLQHAMKMEAVGQLAGGVAHDFNNILTAIIGYSNLLQMKIGENDPLRMHVDHILLSAERATNLVQSLLAFSRKQVINPQPVNLNGVVERIERLLSRVIGEDIQMQTALAEEEIRILADAGQIEQVIMNMAANARDAMPDGGHLTIKTGLSVIDEDFTASHVFAKKGTFGVLTIEDTGSGMDEATRRRIYEPFFTTKEVGKGTGLGMSIVYGIIEQHEGFIDVSSEPGKGAIFRIYLPVNSPDVGHSEEEDKQPREIGATHPATETILLAEDDKRVRKLIKDILEHRGYNVIMAEDGDDALVKFNENQARVQLLLLDVIMPKKNGKDVYDEISRMKPGIKALFLSGYTADIIHKKGIIEDGLSFIMKPVSIKDLLDKVRAVLEA
ncbi:MAG: CHASE domain-containing protein [Nitrospiraceae bacterium]|nr:MAG: CHASE domain-containing protein [Nitrospiraceae bacterium]